METGIPSGLPFLPGALLVEYVSKVPLSLEPCCVLTKALPLKGYGAITC
jgi:hypothetical protein